MGFVAPVVAALGGASTIAAGAAVVGAVGQIQSTRKAAKAQEQAAEQQRVAYQAEQRRAEVQNVRSVRQQIRQARMSQGAMVNTAAISGGMRGSGLAGGTGSVGSQLAGNLGFMANMARENTAISNAQIQSSIFQGQAAKAQATGQVWGQIAGLSNTIFGDMYNPTPNKNTGVEYGGGA